MDMPTEQTQAGMARAFTLVNFLGTVWAISRVQQNFYSVKFYLGRYQLLSCSSLDSPFASVFEK